MSKIKEKWVCRDCGKELPEREASYSGKVPGKCPFCGGTIVKKVVVG